MHGRDHGRHLLIGWAQSGAEGRQDRRRRIHVGWARDDGVEPLDELLEHVVDVASSPQPVVDQVVDVVHLVEEQSARLEHGLAFQRIPRR
jgi:hypothetical protein